MNGTGLPRRWRENVPSQARERLLDKESAGETSNCCVVRLLVAGVVRPA